MKYRIKLIVDRVFFPWGKWKTQQRNKLFIEKSHNYATGYESPERYVFCDVMSRYNKFTGEVQYKTVKRH